MEYSFITSVSNVLHLKTHFFTTATKRINQSVMECEATLTINTRKANYCSAYRARIITTHLDVFIQLLSPKLFTLVYT